MTKRTIAKIAISPGTPARVEDFRYVDQGLEWNMQNEYDLRDDHLQASRVINWEVFGEANLGLSGWVPGDSLLLYVTANELFATEGLAYIGGRSYVLSADAELFDGETPANNTYNIYLKYTLASDEFAYEYTTSTQTDDHLIKYLLIGTCQYTGGTGWIDPPTDKRASNTSLGAPATVSGSDGGAIFTVENTGSGLGLLVKQSDAQIGEDGTPQQIILYGNATNALRVYEDAGDTYVDAVCGGTGEFKVLGKINATGTGSTIASSASVGGVTLNAGVITSGTWQGTAIINAYLASFGTSAQLDQNANQAASPTFVGLTLSGPIATPTTIATSGNITCGGTLTADGVFPEADLADDLGSAALTWQDIFVQNIKDDDGVICAKTASDGKFYLNVGTGVNDIDIVMAGSPTDDQLLTAQGIKEYVDSVGYDADLAIGSGNATWINCPYEGTDLASDKMDLYGRVQPQATGDYIQYAVPLPTTRGGKNLYINGTRVSLSQANGSNYVTNTYIQGSTDSGRTELDDDPTDKNAAQLWTDTSMGALDCSSYHIVKITLKITLPSPNSLYIQFVTVRYYYA